MYVQHMHTNIQTHKHTYLHTYIHMYTHKYNYIYIHEHIHPYIHTYIHTYTHTHIPVHILAVSLPQQKKKIKYILWPGHESVSPVETAIFETGIDKNNSCHTATNCI